MYEYSLEQMYLCWQVEEIDLCWYSCLRKELNYHFSLPFSIHAGKRAYYLYDNYSPVHCNMESSSAKACCLCWTKNDKFHKLIFNVSFSFVLQFFVIHEINLLVKSLNSYSTYSFIVFTLSSTSKPKPKHNHPGQIFERVCLGTSFSLWVRKHLNKVLIKSEYCVASDKNINFIVMLRAKCLLFCTVLLTEVGNIARTLILPTPCFGVHIWCPCVAMGSQNSKVRWRKPQNDGCYKYTLKNYER